MSERRVKNYDFPVCGVAPDRLWTVGSCEICDQALVHFESDGPPVAENRCAFHNKKFQVKKPTPIRKKTAGHMLLDRVCARHKDTRGVGAIKMSEAARRDLIVEIDRTLSGKTEVAA